MPLYDPQGRPIVLPRPRQKTTVGSGVRMLSGVMGWDEPTDLAYGKQRHETLRKMVQTDAYISEVLRSNALPLLARAVWKVQPGLQPSPSETKTREHIRAQLASDLVRANLLGEETKAYGRDYRMATSFKQFLNEALSMLQHGFSLFHKEDRVVRGKRVIKRLLWLEPHTVIKWLVSKDDSIEGVERQYIYADGSTSNTEVLPASELLLFVWDIRGTRLEGVPLIRSMYGPWKRKEFLHRCKMIAFQRAGVGIPYSTRDATQDADDSAEIQTKLDAFLASVINQSLEGGYINMPNPTSTFGFLQQNASDLQKFDGAVADENLSIAHAGGTKAGMLGELPGGARAVGDTQQTLAYILTEAVGIFLAEQINRGVCNLRGVVEQLYDWNYAEDVSCPVLSVTKVDPNETTRNLTLLKDLTSAGVIKPRPQVEQQVYDMIGFDLPDEVFVDVPDQPSPMLPGQSPSPPGQDPDRPQDEKEAPVREAKEEVRAGIARSLATLPLVPSASPSSSPEWRQTTSFEKVCVDLGGMSRAMEQSEGQAASAVGRVWSRMIEDVVSRTRAGKISRGTLGGLRRSRPKGDGTLRDEMRKTLRMIVDHGRASMQRDLALQDKAVQDIRAGRLKPSDLRLAVRPNPNRARIGGLGWVLNILLDDVKEEVNVVASLIVDSLWARLTTEAAKWVTQNPSLTVQEVETGLTAHLNELSTTWASDAASQAAHSAFAQGRDVETKLAAGRGKVNYAIRTEVLDGATCDECRKLDFTVSEKEYEIGSDEYERDMPPAHCKGGERCRGSYLAVVDDLAKLVVNEEGVS